MLLLILPAPVYLATAPGVTEQFLFGAAQNALAQILGQAVTGQGRERAAQRPKLFEELAVFGMFDEQLLDVALFFGAQLAVEKGTDQFFVGIDGHAWQL